MNKREYENSLQTLHANTSDSLEEIKRKYYTLLQKYHPDINSDPNAEEISKQLTIAYNYIKKHYEEYCEQRQNFEKQKEDDTKRKPSVNIKSSRTTIISLCEKLGIDEGTARYRAGAGSIFGIESDDIRVIVYLQKQIEIQELCTRLGTTPNQAEDKFRTKIGYGYSDDKFIRWLKNQAQIQELCTRLGTTPNQAEDKFRAQIGYGYSDDKFIKWLQGQIMNSEFYDQLKVPLEELEKKFGKINISEEELIKILITLKQNQPQNNPSSKKGRR